MATVVVQHVHVVSTVEGNLVFQLLLHLAQKMFSFLLLRLLFFGDRRLPVITVIVETCFVLEFDLSCHFASFHGELRQRVVPLAR